jgi:hypothetical protein
VAFLKAILPQSSFHHLHHSFGQPICLRMILWSSPTIYQCFFTQILEITSEFCTLNGENHNQSTKPIEHFIHKCICSSFIAAI